MNGSAPRAIARLFAYLGLTLPLMPVQALALATGSKLSRRLPVFYHWLCCRMIGIEIDQRGEISPVQPTLFVVNHLSYLDIAVISAVVETSFIAKREVATWPLFGQLARLQRTVFVERRAAGVKNERDEVARRLAQGDNLVLFAEGTSGDGNRLRPFKSALFSVAQIEADGRPVMVQPVTIAYTHLDQMPLGRAWRPLITWFGDMDMLSHGWRFLGLGRVTATLCFHPPVRFDQFGSRKALAEHCESVIAQGLAAANTGRMPSANAPLRQVAALS
jgi:lyso-ornithine lipid O-acyltransferase